MEPDAQKHSLSLDSLQELARNLASELGIAQAALADRNRLTRDGRRMSDHEYHNWRADQILQVQHMHDQLRNIKAEISRLSRERHERGTLARQLGTSEPDTNLVINRAYDFLQQLFKENRVAYSAAEWELVDSLRAYLRLHGR